MEAFICDGVRTPIGKYGGALSTIRTDDLATIPITALKERNSAADWSRVDDVILGCANQSGEDNRNVARMALLLANLPHEIPGMTLNRLCASGMDAVGMAARSIKSGETELMIAGGVESMSRAPFVLSKSKSAFDRSLTMFDTTIGWRFINPAMKKAYGIDSMPETADNVAEQFNINRSDQDAFAERSQNRWKNAQEQGIFSDEIIPVTIQKGKNEPIQFEIDEHPRPDTTLGKLSKLAGINGPKLTVTPGNSSGINDGAAALLIANEENIKTNNLTPIVRVIGMSSAGVEPRIMGIGPVPAIKKVLKHSGLSVDQLDVIEINEAFAAQCLATLREFKIPDATEHVNANGGAIAVGHPLGMSGARLILTAAYHLKRTSGQYALCAMCVGVGQGVAMVLERV